MPRRNDIATMLAIGSLMLAVPSPLFGKNVDVKTVFCVQESAGNWELRLFKPLIDPRAKTRFAEMMFAGPRLLEFRLRRFYEEDEVSFDYRFDEAGRLNALEGSVKVFGAWAAEANLLPNADGTMPPYQVTYSSNNARIRKPDNAADYIAQLDAPPIYQTIESVPCAARMKEAEKMNATQE